MTRQQLQKFQRDGKSEVPAVSPMMMTMPKPRNLNFTTLKGLRIVFSYTFRVLFYPAYIINIGYDLQPVESDSHVFYTVTCLGYVGK
jgi:hypothetical protein